MEWVVLVVLVGLTGGYAWGRRQGITEGVKMGRTLAPLELREQSLKEGYCLLCQKRNEQASFNSSLLML